MKAAGVLIAAASRIMLRHEQSLGVLVAIILYVSVSTALLCVQALAMAEVDLVSSRIVFTGDTCPCNDSVSYGFANVSYAGREYAAVVIIVDNVSSLRAYGVSFSGRPELIGGRNVSIGEDLAELLGVGIGDSIVVEPARGGPPLALNIVSTHRGPGVFSLTIVSRSPINGSRQGPLCVVRGSVFSSIIGDVAGGVIGVVDTVVAAVSSVMPIAVGALFYRLALSLRRALLGLYEQGASKYGVLLCMLALASMIALAGWAIGVSLGLLIAQISAFLLRFRGVIVPLKPVVPLDKALLLLPLTAVACLASAAISWYYMVYRNGGA